MEKFHSCYSSYLFAVLNWLEKLVDCYWKLQRKEFVSIWGKIPRILKNNNNSDDNTTFGNQYKIYLKTNLREVGLSKNKNRRRREEKVRFMYDQITLQKNFAFLRRGAKRNPLMGNKNLRNSQKILKDFLIEMKMTIKKRVQYVWRHVV